MANMPSAARLRAATSEMAALLGMFEGELQAKTDALRERERALAELERHAAEALAEGERFIEQEKVELERHAAEALAEGERFIEQQVARGERFIEQQMVVLERRAAELHRREQRLDAREATLREADREGGQREGVAAAPSASSSQARHGMQGMNYPVGVADLQLLASATAAALRIHAL